MTVVCLALAQTDWYMRQLRDNPVRDFDEANAPAVWQGRHPVKPDWPLHTMTDAEIRTAAASPVLLDTAVTLTVGSAKAVFKAGTVLYPNDIVSLRILQQNIGRRDDRLVHHDGRQFRGAARLRRAAGTGFPPRGCRCWTQPGMD